MAVRCYIALGSNLGRRELQLRFAAQYLDRHPEVKVVAASHCYETPALLPEGAPEAWNIAYLNQVLAIDTSLPPLSLLALLKECEAAAGRKKTAHWGPRELDCDLLLYGDEQISLPELTVPHAELAKRDFVLVPLAEIASELMVPGRGETVGALCAKLSSSLALYRRRTKVMGIVNVTPDSFSSRADAREAIRLIERMAGEGADMIDIGGESTRPGAVPLSPDEEWARIVPVLSALPESRRWKVSVDTYHPETAARALAAGADMINDVSGGAQAAMWRHVAEHKKPIILMHSLTVPADPAVRLPEQENPVEVVIAWAKTLVKKAEQFGIPKEQVILDPGIGFGKSALQSLDIIVHMDDIMRAVPDVPWLVGHSRKSFLSLFSPVPAIERDGVTLAISALLCDQCVDIVRVHEVVGHRRLAEGWARL